MPIYEYRCQGCGKNFEVIQKFSDAPLETHADCGGSVERLLSAPALQFKGSGWYITDYAKSGGSSGKSNGGASSGASSESKKETKSSDSGSSSTSTPAAKSD